MNIEPFTFVLERVGQLLVDEIKLLSTDKKKLLDRLQRQVELAQGFVKDVEEEKEHTAGTHVLEAELKQIMGILPQIEDYLDTIHLEEEVQKSHPVPNFFQNLKACFSCASNPVVRRHVVIDTGAQLIKELKDIREQALTFQRQSAIPRTSRRRRPLPQTQPHIIYGEFIVGLDEDVKTILCELSKKNATILAIVGMGGSGKTTLSRKIYNHQEVMGMFNNQAWICVSKDWDASQLLRQMCVQLHIQLAESETSAASSKLREFFRTNSCLVVLDDVWEKAALQELLRLLLSGSVKVLVTTRNEEIFHNLVQGGVYIHEARRLTEEESWDLFSKIVRSNWQGIRDFDDETEFAKLGKQMLERCHGLPLAIVALAGLLSTKGTIQDWETLKDNVSSAIMRQNKGFLDYGPVKYMLELSYSDLPYNLKLCFLYLGIFPEDSEIGVGGLIQIWIGEGFLRSNLLHEAQTLEELGMDVMNELVQRCMVQVVRRDYEEKANTIQVHDLMRDLCINKARESGFFDVASPSTVHSNTMDLKLRRAIIFENGNSCPISKTRLRSVIKFPKYGEPNIKLEMLYESMRLLRVLDIEDVDLRNIEVHIGNLILLRHLRIYHCDGAMNLVLESVKKLRNLLTFIFSSRDDGSIKVPNDMVGSMEHLRCLTLRRARYDFPSGLGFGSSSLQSLESPPGEWLCKDLRAASLIHSLRRLKLGGVCTQAHLDVVLDFVGTPTNHLQALDLKADPSSEFDLKRMKLERCLRLKQLCLDGQIRKQDEPICFPPNLLKLSLHFSKIENREELKRALAQLHQLRFLMLSTGSYVGDKLTMVGLPQLQHLELWSLYNLKEWRIEQGTICRLKHLKLFACLELERIPEGISGIHSLQYFEAHNMPPRFCKRLEKPSEEEGKVGGEDFHLIRHIPTIFFQGNNRY